ncbi:DUF3795 domain-containing protein [Methanospirillum lacunae]|nr:DUF3795 domain-containing protein [Methanospirillum lacunae]
MEEQMYDDNKVTRSEDIRACCGFHCSQCPAYIGNIKSEEDRNRVSETWHKIYGLEIPAEAIRCDGCLKPDSENPFRIGGDCGMRNCVQDRKIAHCGECNEFPCDRIEQHMASVESVAPGCRDTLTPDEFKDFIEPYLCREFMKMT